MNGTRGTYSHALAAHLTDVEVDICQVVLQRDGPKGAHTLAGTAAYTGHGTTFARFAAFFLVAAGHIYAMSFGTFVAQLQQVAGAGSHAGTTGHTAVFVDSGQTRTGIHSQRVELTCFHAVA